jgi:hypothetical protein
MKKYLLLLSALLFISMVSRAQFSKGSILLGGQLSFGTSSYNDPSNTNPNQNSTGGTFDVSVGKAFRENAVYGLDLSYSYNNNGGGSLGSSNNFYDVGIFYRKYKDLGKDFFLFGQVGAGYSGSTETGPDSAGNKVTIGTSHGGQIYLYPGIAYRISNKFFLELSIPELFAMQYSYVKTTNSGQDMVSHNFSVSTTLGSNPLSSLGLGFRLVL